MISEIQDAGMRTTRQISVNSPWGMTLAGRQMLPALVRRVNIPLQTSAASALDSPSVWNVV